jgi:predicted HAD superfamily hydrolase
LKEDRKLDGGIQLASMQNLAATCIQNDIVVSNKVLDYDYVFVARTYILFFLLNIYIKEKAYNTSYSYPPWPSSCQSVTAYSPKPGMYKLVLSNNCMRRANIIHYALLTPPKSDRHPFCGKGRGM